MINITASLISPLQTSKDTGPVAHSGADTASNKNASRRWHSSQQSALCLVLFFFIVDHEMDSHAENQILHGRSP